MSKPRFYGEAMPAMPKTVVTTEALKRFPNTKKCATLGCNRLIFRLATFDYCAVCVVDLIESKVSRPLPITVKPYNLYNINSLKGVA